MTERERTIKMIGDCMLRQSPTIGAGPSTLRSDETAERSSPIALIQGEGVIEGYIPVNIGGTVFNDAGEVVLW